MVVVHNRDRPFISSFPNRMHTYVYTNYADCRILIRYLTSIFELPIHPIASFKCKGMDKTFSFLNLEVCLNYAIFIIIFFLLFFHWATAKCGQFMRRKIHSLPSYLLLHVCDLFSYANVSVNMHFEAVLLLVGSLSH